MSFAATWMDLEIIILSEVRQIKTNIIGYLLICGIQKNGYEWTYLQNRSRSIDIENKHCFTKGNYRGEKDKLGNWD